MNALKQYCSDKSLVEIAKELVDCDQMWPYMEISEARHEEICRDTLGNYRNYKHQLLVIWREHHGTESTYQKLCDVFKDCDKRDIIDVVKKQALCGQCIRIVNN